MSTYVVTFEPRTMARQYSNNLYQNKFDYSHTLQLAPFSSCQAPQPPKEGMPYDFTWDVDDGDSGNFFSHVESSDGRTTQGEYQVLLPDGRTQVGPTPNIKVRQLCPNILFPDCPCPTIGRPEVINKVTSVEVGRFYEHCQPLYSLVIPPAAK